MHVPQPEIPVQARARPDAGRARRAAGAGAGARTRLGAGLAVAPAALGVRQAAGDGGSAARPTVSLERASEPEEPGPADEKAEARAAAQRERVRAKREESVLAGLDELDRWIGDEIDAGLAAFPQRAPQRCRIAAQRLVDAKAPALATRLDALPAELLGLPEDERGRHAIEVLGSLHLLAEAYRRQERLPAPLRSDVRRLVGWTVERQELMDDSSALRVSAPWLVAAVHSEVQPDRLRRIETWLMRGEEGDPGFAVLIDFVPLASGQGGSAYVPGEAFDAELVFYPSTAPLRAVIASRGEARQIEWPNAGRSLSSALDHYEALCASHPWLSGWPFVIEGGRIAGIPGTGLWLMQDSEAVPIAPAAAAGRARADRRGALARRRPVGRAQLCAARRADVARPLACELKPLR